VWDTPARIRHGALQFIKKLQRDGYRVIGISHRVTRDAKFAAVRDFVDLGLDDYYLTGEKGTKINTLCAENESWHPLAFIDDKPANVVEVADKCANTLPRMRCYLWTRSHNQPNYNAFNKYEIVPDDFVDFYARTLRWND
jgi:hypothetical protein